MVTLVATSLVLVSTAWLPTTVIDSRSTVDLEIRGFISSDCPTRTVTVWLMASNPAAATTTLYSPGVSPARVYVPSAPEWTVFTNPLCVLTALISAFASGCPWSLVTFPRMVAVLDCPNAAMAANETSNHAHIVFLLMKFLLCGLAAGSLSNCG